MTAPLWTTDEIAAATGGHANRAIAVSGVAIDGRKVAPGDLFVALPGTAADGHEFVAQAFANGATAALVARRPANVSDAAPLVHVADTQAGLEALGTAARARAQNARIVGVTGSVGKTGTRTALEHVLSAQGKTHASQASYNNHVGVPLSLARMPAGVRFGVFEMGMNHAGEIARLTVQVRPHVAIITTIEAVHLEFFDSIEGIADAKAEIFLGLEPDGVAILNRDNPHYERLAKAARARPARIVTFGTHEAADVRLVDMALKPDCSCVSAEVFGARHAFKIGTPGRHWVMNGLAVLAAVEAVGADISLAGLALASLENPDGRGKRQTVEIPGGIFTLIDESYNASPASMRATFDTVGRIKPEGRGRRIAVLGDMRELGPTAPDLHADLAPALEAARFDVVHTAGSHMANLHTALPDKMRGAHVATSAELGPIVAASVRPGDVVVVKGSLGSRMGPIVELLRSLGGQSAAGAAE
jgi:UDP-N-acetylmuramoyl-tripeptide--D-alanyl-D-alanine ligase